MLTVWVVWIVCSICVWCIHLCWTIVCKANCPTGTLHFYFSPDHQRKKVFCPLLCHYETVGLLCSENIVCLKARPNEECTIFFFFSVPVVWYEFMMFQPLITTSGCPWHLWWNPCFILKTVRALCTVPAFFFCVLQILEQPILETHTVNFRGK